MTLRADAISRGEYQTPARGLGQLYDGAVTTSGADFILTAWAGHLINVDVDVDCQACWSETSGATFTSTTNRDASTAAALTVPFRVRAGQRNEFVVPTSSLSTPAVYLRIATITGTTPVIVDRATAVATAG